MPPEKRQCINGAPSAAPSAIPSTTPSTMPSKRHDKIIQKVTPDTTITSIESTQIGDETPPAQAPSSTQVLPQVSAENLKATLLGKYVKPSPYSLYRDRTAAASIARVSATDRASHQYPSDTTTGSSPQSTVTTLHRNEGQQDLIAPTAYQQDQVPTPDESRMLIVPLPPAPIGPLKPRPIDIRESILPAVKALLQQSDTLQEPHFRFDISKEAADYNLSLLQQNSFQLESLLNDPKRPSVTTYGSEFKPIQELQFLLGKHPRWPIMKKLLQHGSSWKLKDVQEDVRTQDMEAALKRGNHKSAAKHADFLVNALSKEIVKGWELLLPASAAKIIPTLVLSPMGVAEHLGVQADGSFAPKKRVTHDLSFPGVVSEQSINSRILEDHLEPCMFGHALLRIVHRVIHLRLLYPATRIWMRKDDAKSAYRRVHLNATTVFQTAVQLVIQGIHFILLALRLPFGGSACPSEFCLVSDIIADVTNDLFADPQWDPHKVSSSFLHKVPMPQPLPSHIPFAQAQSTSVPNLEGDNCTADVFIDDIITVGVDTGNNATKLRAGPCTAMHAIAQQGNEEMSIPRQDFIAMDKNEAEGAPEEIKIILGWVIDSRRLLIQLPAHKHAAWTSQLQSFTQRKSTNSKDIESLLGRLEQVALILPMFGHFLNNIRHTQIKAAAARRPHLINKRTRDDLILAQSFLDHAVRGVNLNLMTFREPTHFYINDASEHGIGGFATHGRGWAWTIPAKLRGRAHINLLEFLAQLVSIWIDIAEHRITPLDCLLGMGDNTAAMGWLRRANFRERDENDRDWYAKQCVARKLASLVLESNTVLYRQWFRGADNAVADSLSRDAYFLTPASHKQFLLSTIPHQIPKNFRVLPIPKEISSFISLTLQRMPVKPLRLHPPKPSDLALSNVGLVSSLKLASNQSFSKIFPDSSRTSSCLPSPKPCERPPSLEAITKSWWRAQSMPPSHMWHRPSGQTTGRTPDWTLTGRCASSYRNR